MEPVRNTLDIGPIYYSDYVISAWDCRFVAFRLHYCGKRRRADSVADGSTRCSDKLDNAGDILAVSAHYQIFWP